MDFNADAEYAIAARGVRKTYAATKKAPAKEALKGVDILVRRGSIFGLLGPNGAGKSTFINILAGLVNKSAGDVSVWGFDIDRNPRQARAALGIVPQEINMDVFFTPKEALEIQAGLYGVPKSQRRTMEILSALGLEDKASAYVRMLSGGMKRRLLVAKAMVHSPPILILDEPPPVSSSFPAPPLIVSRPRPPKRRSSPSSPFSTSAPLPPFKRSSPVPP